MITTLDQVRLIKRYIFRIRNLFTTGQLIEIKTTQQYTSEALMIINHLEDLLGRNSDGSIMCEGCFLTHKPPNTENFSAWIDFIQPFIDNALFPILEEQKYH